MCYTGREGPISTSIGASTTHPPSICGTDTRSIDTLSPGTHPGPKTAKKKCAMDIDRLHVRATPQGCNHMAQLDHHTKSWELVSAADQFKKQGAVNEQ
jgi:hypothetical protein